MAQQVDSRQALRTLSEIDPDYARIDVEIVPDTRTPDEIAEDRAIQLQSLSEGLSPERDESGNLARRVEFKGERFRIQSSVGLLPLMEFAYHASSGLDTADMYSLAAMYEMLQDCIEPEDWPAFRQHARKAKASMDDILAVVQDTIELMTARPTRQESDSSRQQSRTPDSLTDTSSGQRDQLVSVQDIARQGFSG